MLLGCAATPPTAAPTSQATPTNGVPATATAGPRASSTPASSAGPSGAPVGSGSFTYTRTIDGSDDYAYPNGAGHENGTYSNNHTISGQLTVVPQDLSDPNQLVYAILGTYQLSVAAASNYTFNITESADLHGSGTMNTDVSGTATDHDPPQPGDSRYQQEIANGETASDIAQETGLLTVGFDDTGEPIYELGIHAAATITPTYTYDSATTGVFVNLNGNCHRTFDNVSGNLTQSGACGAVTAPLGPVSVDLSVPFDLFANGAFDPTTGSLQIKNNATSTTCTIADVHPSVSGEESFGGTTNTDPLYITDAPQTCSETTNFQLQLSFPPLSKPSP